MIKTIVKVLISIFPLCTFGNPTQPAEPEHPGSSAYEFQAQKVDFKCNDRAMTAMIPNPAPSQKTPMIIFGHGQALGFSDYEETFKHLAQKGFVVVHPMYDTGFFDQNWKRMGADYINLSSCAADKFLDIINTNQIIFSGHSKGAYVASIAAGLASDSIYKIKPASVVVFATAGIDSATAKKIAPEVELTAIFGEADGIVKESFSYDLFNLALSAKKQFIKVKNYPSTGAGTKADHMFVLTKASTFGGSAPGPLHYFGKWKWLTAAAYDLQDGAKGVNPYLYGDQTIDKGISDVRDSIVRAGFNLSNDEYFIRFNESADLREVDLLTNKISRGSAIYTKLVNTARSSQKSVANYLAKRGLDFKSYYIDNSILVKNLSEQDLRFLKSQNEVKEVVKNQIIKLPTLPQVQVVPEINMWTLSRK